MNYYETVIILKADLSDEGIKETIEKTKGQIEGQGGRILRYEDWGRKRLAYEIKRQGRGAYHLLQYAAPPQVLTEMDRSLKLNEGVLRFMTLRLKGEPAAKEEKAPEPARPAEREASEEVAPITGAEEV